MYIGGAGDVDPGDRQLDGHLVAVGVQAGGLHARADEVPGAAGQAGPMGAAQRCRHEHVGQLAAHQRVRAVAEDGVGGRVGLDDGAGVVDGDDRVERRVEHSPLARLALAVLEPLADPPAEAGQGAQQVGVRRCGSRWSGTRARRRRPAGRRTRSAGRRPPGPGGSSRRRRCPGSRPARRWPARGRAGLRRARARARATPRRSGRPQARPRWRRSGPAPACGSQAPP